MRYRIYLSGRAPAKPDHDIELVDSFSPNKEAKLIMMDYSLFREAFAEEINRWKARKDGFKAKDILTNFQE